MPDSRRGEWERLVLEASAQHSQGCLGEAIATYRQLVSLRPDVPEVHFHLGNALYEAADVDGALGAYRRAIRLRPAYPAAHAHLGVALRAKGEWDAAIAAARDAVAQCPQAADGHYSLGAALLLTGRLDEAEAPLRRAVALAPDRPDLHITLSILLLLEGRYEEGWPEYEWHHPAEDRDSAGPLPPRWQGEDLGGRALVIRGEQGVGDELVYFSVVAELAARGIRCVASADARLLGLLRRSVPDALVLEREGALPDDLLDIEVGARLPAAGLLRLKAPSAREIDPVRPYLRPDPAAAARLRRSYAEGGRPVVGLSWWSANPDRRRASFAALAEWLPILRVPGLRFVSLQYGDHGAEIAALRREAGLDILLDDSVDAHGDLDGFAAQVAAVDLVVTIDNSAALFAACLGRPAFVLVDAVPDFRMGRTGERSPWYSGLRIFRQRRPGDWAPVVADVAEALRQWKGPPT